MKITQDAVVVMDYELRIGGHDGEVIETTLNGQREPFKFTYGHGEIHPLLEEAIHNKEAGDVVQIVIPPEQAYGLRNEEAIQKLPRALFPEELELKEGMKLVMKTPEGEDIGMQVVSFDDESVTVDFNHPLAGEALYFTIYIREVKKT